jgi:hypothetical protein
MFPVYIGKCLLRKAVHNWVGKLFADDEEVEMVVRKWLRQQSIVKRWDKCINVGGGYVEK